MDLDLGGWSQLILALVGVFGAISAFYLNRRGSDQQSLQQHAANDLANRAQGFDEMKAILGALREEIARKEADRVREVAAQAAHCRHAFEGFFVAFQALQAHVESAAVRQGADEARAEAERHLQAHPSAEPETA